jgi:hypothetical protein
VIALVVDWSNSYVDGYLVFQHPFIIAGYPHRDCTNDWASGLLLFDPRLCDRFEREVAVLSPEESPLDHQAVERPVSRRY